MRKYESSSRDVKVIGQALNAILQSINHPTFADILAQNGLDHVNSDAWYPYQILLDFYRVLADHPNSSENFVSIGMKIIDTAIVPPEINSIPTALNMLNGMISLNMSGPVQDTYIVEHIGERHYRVVDSTAFPHDLNYGFLYGIVNRFRAAGDDPIVVRTFHNPAAVDEGDATYDITW